MKDRPELSVDIPSIMTDEQSNMFLKTASVSEYPSSARNDMRKSEVGKSEITRLPLSQ